MKQNSRRELLKTAAAAAVTMSGTAVLATEGEAQASKPLPLEKKTVSSKPAGGKDSMAAVEAPLFSSIVTYGNLVFLSGVGAHFPGTIEEHTKHVLDELEKNLVAAGSSMEKVLKVNCYLNDLKDWPKMNSVYGGRWGKIPPVRTTIAAAGGIPGDSLVEIDCIAYI